MLRVQPSAHCSDNKADRSIGEYWENQFCSMARQYGLSFTPHQFKRSVSACAYTLREGAPHAYTLPDITIWTAPGQHHEIKHKNPTSKGYFGLEVYRFDALIWFTEETSQPVYYTIHNHDLSGGRDSRANNIHHWMTASVKTLRSYRGYIDRNFSYVRGERREVDIHYWPTDAWRPLTDLWRIPVIGSLNESSERECSGLGCGNVFIPDSEGQTECIHCRW